jgi:hypothetical protein
MKTNKISVTVYEQRTFEVAPKYPVYFHNNEKYTPALYKFYTDKAYTIVVVGINCIYTQKSGTVDISHAYANFKQIDADEFATAMRGVMESVDVLVTELEHEYEQETLPEDVKRQQIIEAREQDAYDNHRNH